MSRRLLRFAPALLLLAIAAAAVASGLTRDLTPSGIAAHRAAWSAMARAHPVASLASYVTAYAALTGAGLPVALVLTLTGGLIFGAEVGGLATAAAATTAALISYAAARYALADWIQRRLPASGRLEQLVEALRTRGFWFMLSARLMPVMPFPLVNVACGVARVPLRNYALATAAGALPSSFIYATLGSGLGASLSSGHIGAAVRSPSVWLPLAALAALSLLPPLVGRGAAQSASAKGSSS